MLCLGPNVVCVSAMSMFDAASGFQFEDSKVVIRGFKSHDKQYNDQMKTIQSISQKTKEWATTKSRETTM